MECPKMNMAIRGIDAHIEWADTFQNDKHKDLKADYIIANPPPWMTSNPITMY